MAVTVTKDKVFVVGDRKRVEATVLFDNSYPTGGESLTAADLGLELEVNAVLPGAVTTNNAASTDKRAVYDHVNSKLALFTGITEATAASDQSTVRVRVSAVGKGSAAV